MVYRICKSILIESGHLLSKHAGKCRFPHGHSRRVDVVLAAERLDANDMVWDFKALKTAMQAVLEAWDHALCINTEDPQYPFFSGTYGTRVLAFEEEDPTSEVMARTLFERWKDDLGAAGLPPGVKLERVRVTETDSSWAEYGE